jgi:hypothetical protein
LLSLKYHQQIALPLGLYLLWVLKVVAPEPARQLPWEPLVAWAPALLRWELMRGGSPAEWAPQLLG